MISRISFVFVLVLSIGTLCYGYSDCGSTAGKVENLVISGCDNSKTCILKRNTNVSLEIDFVASEDSDTLSAVVYGVILGVPLPFQVPNADACHDSGITCPLKAGQAYKYKNALPILGSYPRVTVDVKWYLKTSSDKDAVCVEIPAKIK